VLEHLVVGWKGTEIFGVFVIGIICSIFEITDSSLQIRISGFSGPGDKDEDL
jgi:hypothetical protein